MKEETEKLKRIIVELEKELKQANKVIDYLIMRDATIFNYDRWMTVIQFYDYVLSEKEILNRKNDKTYMHNQTEKILEAMRSPILQKKDSTEIYYRIEDIVSSAHIANFIKQRKINFIITELKDDKYSKTKPDLEVDGFKHITYKINGAK